MRRLTLTILALLLVPALAYAGEARVRALAAGDARLLPDDDGNIGVFPNVINQHQRITLNNVAPGGNVPDPAFGNELADEDSWGEATWAMWGGTVGWAVNRPTMAHLHQHRVTEQIEQTPGVDENRIPERATAFADFAWGNDSWGFIADVGTSSREVDDDESTNPDDRETLRNTMLDAVAGWNLSGGMEFAAGVSISSLGALELDDQKKSAFFVGANVRKELGWEFFNHAVLGANFSKDVKVSNDPDDDAPSGMGADFKLFRYANASTGSDGGVTYLLAIGAGLQSNDSGIADTDRATSITLPSATAGAEYSLTNWLDIRGSASKSFVWTFESDNNSSGSTSMLTTLGATGHWGDFSIHGVLNNQLFEDGPNFVGGRAPGVAHYVSASYKL